MDKLSQISLQNTVSVKIDCLLNQELLAKNFGIIMDCLKDLKTQVDKHSSELNGLSGLKELMNKMRQDIRDNSELISKKSDKSDKSDNQHKEGVNSHHIDQAVIDNLEEEIKQLKQRMTANEGNVKGNTSDIKELSSDMSTAKQDIESLKRQLKDIGNNSSQPSSFTNINLTHGATNNNPLDTTVTKTLTKNDNLGQQTLNDLNHQALEHNRAISDLEKQMEEMRRLVKRLEGEVNGVKGGLEDRRLMDQTLNVNGNANGNNGNNGINGINDNSNNNNNNNNSNNGPTDAKSLSDLTKRVQFLTKKTENIQSQVLNNTRCINQLNESTQKTIEQLDQQKQDLNGVHEEIQEINRILEQLQNLMNNNGGNNDNDNLLNQIERLKEQYEKLLKMLNNLKTTSKSPTDLDPTTQDLNSKLPSSSKNIQKLSQQRSFRKRSDSIDVNGKIKQLTQRIRYLQKVSQQENPQKLPSIGWKKPNQTSYNSGEKSHKKQLAEMKNELEIWIKSYLDAHSKGNGNLHDIELKVQEIRTLVMRKADHEGMKKGLAFLEGKITQLYLFLTEPDAEDAMIVRKGFNCLSCSKKVETLRGKLGPRMNWDNLNTNMHNHTPPKIGFPKYADSNEKESM